MEASIYLCAVIRAVQTVSRMPHLTFLHLMKPDDYVHFKEATVDQEHVEYA